MGRVGDELLLPPDVFKLRTDDPGGKNVDQQERDAHPADGDPERHSEDPFNRTDLGLTVDEGGDVATIAAASGFPEVDTGPSEADLLADDAVSHPDAFFFAYFRDMRINDIRYRLAVRFVEDREITRGQSEFRGEVVEILPVVRIRAVRFADCLRIGTVFRAV